MTAPTDTPAPAGTDTRPARPTPRTPPLLPANLFPLPPKTRVAGDVAKKVSAALTLAYTKGSSIRALAEASGRSYGYIHRVLTKAKVPRRHRGGTNRKRPTT